MINEKTINALQAAEEMLSPYNLQMQRPEEFRLDVLVPVSLLLDLVALIIEKRWGYLSTITGLDRPAEEKQEASDRQQDGDIQSGDEQEGSIEVLYHFCNGAAVLTLHVWISYTNPVVPSVFNLMPSAMLYERELAEMFGVQILDNPYADEHLLLPENWPENVYPLRKSFTGLEDTDKI